MSSKLLPQVCKDYITPILRPLKYKRKGNSYYRREGSAVQGFNFQGSMGGQQFYINIGVSCDEICLHLGIAIEETPSIPGCMERGFYDRLDGQIDVPPWFNYSEVNEDCSILKSTILQADALLAGIHDLKSLIDGPLIGPNVYVWQKAVYLYLSGEAGRCAEMVNNLCIARKDNVFCSKFDFWVKKYKLAGLMPPSPTIT